MKVKIKGAIIGMLSSILFTFLFIYAGGIITKPSTLTYSEALVRINEATFHQDTLRHIPTILLIGLLIGYVCAIVIEKRRQCRRKVNSIRQP